jgi:hypothetical protein
MGNAPRLTVAAILLVAGVLALRRVRDASDRAAPRPAPAAPAPEAPAAARQPAPPGRMLLVRVLAAESGAPLVGATILVEPWEGGAPPAVTADERGEARIAPLMGEVSAQARGYARETVLVSPATPRLIFLLRAAVPVRGRVVRAGVGVAGASVVATDIDESETIAELVTDQEGRFEIPGVPPDAPFLVAAEHPGFAPAARVERRPDADREIVLELGQGAAIEGRVLAPDGSGAAGAEVTVWPRGGEELLSRDVYGNPDYVAKARTDADGRFRVEGLRVPAD